MIAPMPRFSLPLGVLVIAVLVGCGSRPPPGIHTDYEIPANYTGWVTIVFGVSGAPPLPVRGGTRQVHVAAAGNLATATPQITGVVVNRFYFVDAAGARTTIPWPESTPGTDPATVDRAYPQPVILRLVTGDTTTNGHRTAFEQFYVGRGPAGDPPGVP